MKANRGPFSEAISDAKWAERFVKSEPLAKTVLGFKCDPLSGFKFTPKDATGRVRLGSGHRQAPSRFGLAGPGPSTLAGKAIAGPWKWPRRIACGLTRSAATFVDASTTQNRMPAPASPLTVTASSSSQPLNSMTGSPSLGRLCASRSSFAALSMRSARENPSFGEVTAWPLARPPRISDHT